MYLASNLSALSPAQEKQISHHTRTETKCFSSNLLHEKEQAQNKDRQAPYHRGVKMIEGNHTPVFFPLSFGLRSHLPILAHQNGLHFKPAAVKVIPDILYYYSPALEFSLSMTFKEWNAVCL